LFSKITIFSKSQNAFNTSKQIKETSSGAKQQQQQEQQQQQQQQQQKYHLLRNIYTRE